MFLLVQERRDTGMKDWEEINYAWETTARYDRCSLAPRSPIPLAQPMPYWFAGQFYQGSQIAIAVDDPALLYGATVFSTLRVYGQSLDHPLTAWATHCHRLRHSLHHFGWPAPDWEHLRQGAEWLLPDYPVLRLTCLSDGRELVTGRFLPADLPQRQQRGINAWVAQSADYQRPLPGHKTGNYLGGWLALQRAKERGAAEAILVNAVGEWLETSTGNLWGWRKGQWFTPPLAAGILPGVIRRQLICHLQAQGNVVNQAAWTPEIVSALESLAYTNAVIQLIPIHTVLNEGSRLEYNPDHRALQALRAAFDGV